MTIHKNNQKGRPMTSSAPTELTDDSGDICFPETGTIRAKWILDGATTLAEAALKAREFADWLQDLHDGGYVLEDEISDDYGFYRKPSAN